MHPFDVLTIRHKCCRRTRSNYYPTLHRSTATLVRTSSVGPCLKTGLCLHACHCNMDSRGDEQPCCTKCRALTGTLDGLRAACSVNGYPYWSHKGELSSGAQKCSLCKIIWEARSWKSTKLSGPLRIHANLGVSSNDETADSLDIEHPLKGRTLSGFGVHDSSSLKTLATLYVSTPQDDPASVVVRTRPVLADVGSEIALEQARIWLSTCEKLHTRCPGSRETPMPSRVLRVGKDTTDPYVYLQSASGQMGTYIALSYCWGASGQPTTTKSNLASRERQIALNHLPQTVRDAIHITRRLDVPFLWIDALCIVQDDEEERVREMRNMGNVYKNAILTIAASSSASVENGFLQRRNDPISAHLTVYLSEGIIGSVRLSGWRFVFLSDEPLNSRGWTFQEHLLSRRMLLYTKHEMLWRCNTHAFIPVRRSHLHYDNFIPNLPLQVFNIPINPRLSLRKQQVEIWPSIVSQYSSRTLSIPGDRIYALAGVAAELSAVWRDVYMLGLWSKTFIQNLAWRRCAKQEPYERLPAVPTWSWMSLNCRTEMWPRLCLEDAQLVFDQNKLLLPITTREDLADGRGNIYVRARVLDGVSFIERTNGRHYMLDMDVYDSKSLECDLLVALLGFDKQMDGDALCLILCATDDGRFARVGRVRSWGIKWEEIGYRELAII